METPIGIDGKPMLSFEERTVLSENLVLEKKIFIDGEELDWSINQSDLADAMSMGPKFFKEIKADIAKHFVLSVSDFIGRHVTLEDINNARKTGWI